MIEFECPECGELLEVSRRKAGERVRCVECGERVRVPERRGRGFGRDRFSRSPGGLTQGEYVAFLLIFLSFPLGGVVIGRIMYMCWYSSAPAKADQIRSLGLMTCLIQLVPMCCLGSLGLCANPNVAMRRR